MFKRTPKFWKSPFAFLSRSSRLPIIVKFWGKTFCQNQGYGIVHLETGTHPVWFKLCWNLGREVIKEVALDWEEAEEFLPVLPQLRLQCLQPNWPLDHLWHTPSSHWGQNVVREIGVLPIDRLGACSPLSFEDGINEELKNRDLSSTSLKGNFHPHSDNFVCEDGPLKLLLLVGRPQGVKSQN